MIYIPLAATAANRSLLIRTNKLIRLSQDQGQEQGQGL